MISSSLHVLILSAQEQHALHKLKVEGKSSFAKDKIWLLDDIKLVDGVKDNAVQCAALRLYLYHT